MITTTGILNSLIHLFYPHTCATCSSDALGKDELLCVQCIAELPHTNYENIIGNPVEKIFWGRVNINAAFAWLYFHKGQIVQQIIHQLKYRGNKEIGIYMGKMMGEAINASTRFSEIDYLIPLPLFAKKEFRRGYNQATQICIGMAESTNIPLMEKNVVRRLPTETQTKKHRTERWENVAESFGINNPSFLENKHILLVDDVLTTGATIEACCLAIKDIPGIKISVCTLAAASR